MSRPTGTVPKPTSGPQTVFDAVTGIIRCRSAVGRRVASRARSIDDLPALFSAEGEPRKS